LGVCVAFGLGVCVALGFGACFAFTLCFALGVCVAFGCGLKVGIGVGTGVADVTPAANWLGCGVGVGVGLPGIPIRKGPTPGSAVAEFLNALRPFQLSANAVNAITMAAKATNASVDRRDHLRPRSLNTRTT